MKGPTICRLPCGSARRTSKPSPRSRVRGTMTSSSASQDMGSPSTGSLEGSQLMGNSFEFLLLPRSYQESEPSSLRKQGPITTGDNCLHVLYTGQTMGRGVWVPAFAGTTVNFKDGEKMIAPL